MVLAWLCGPHLGGTGGDAGSDGGDGESCVGPPLPEAQAVRRAPRARAAQGASPMARAGRWGRAAAAAAAARAGGGGGGGYYGGGGGGGQIETGDFFVGRGWRGRRLQPGATRRQRDPDPGHHRRSVGDHQLQAGGVGTSLLLPSSHRPKRNARRAATKEFGFKNQGQCIKAVNHPS